MRGSQYENKLAIYLFKTRERETVLKFCAAFEEVILKRAGRVETRSGTRMIAAYSLK